MRRERIAEVWAFVRHDPVGRWLGIAWAVIAWFALTWLSVGVALLLLVMSALVLTAQRRRRDFVVEDELDDLF
jgi:hypothetical protein